MSSVLNSPAAPLLSSSLSSSCSVHAWTQLCFPALSSQASSPAAVAVIWPVQAEGCRGLGVWLRSDTQPYSPFPFPWPSLAGQKVGSCRTGGSVEQELAEVGVSVGRQCNSMIQPSTWAC
ncbi:uncharacterized [Lates japonicus]